MPYIRAVRTVTGSTCAEHLVCVIKCLTGLFVLTLCRPLILLSIIPWLAIVQGKEKSRHICCRCYCLLTICGCTCISCIPDKKCLIFIFISSHHHMCAWIYVHVYINLPFIYSYFESENIYCVVEILLQNQRFLATAVNLILSFFKDRARHKIFKDKLSGR